MALIECPDCGKKVSERADACIHCGCPLDDGAGRRTDDPSGAEAKAPPPQGARCLADSAAPQTTERAADEMRSDPVSDPEMELHADGRITGRWCENCRQYTVTVFLKGGRDLKNLFWAGGAFLVFIIVGGMAASVEDGGGTAPGWMGFVALTSGLFGLVCVYFGLKKQDVLQCMNCGKRSYMMIDFDSVASFRDRSRE